MRSRQETKSFPRRFESEKASGLRLESHPKQSAASARSGEEGDDSSSLNDVRHEPAGLASRAQTSLEEYTSLARSFRDSTLTQMTKES